MRAEVELEAELASPSAQLVEDLSGTSGDILVLGAGGKMGPSLVRLARNAVAEAGLDSKVIAVSRFSGGGLADRLRDDGVEVVRADIADETDLAALPDAANVIYMVGAKFGTTGEEHRTWATNAYLPGRVAERYRRSRIAAFSTGNVYPLVPVGSGGADERHPTGPVGEYAMSCLGRERVLEHVSVRYGTPMALLRLNYAIDLRYGVLCDIARAVLERRPVDLSMGCVNVVWQGYANEVALRSLRHAGTPPTLINVTGPETISVRWLAATFGELLGVEPIYAGEEAGNALLANAGRAHRLFGYPRVSLGQLIEWTVDWLRAGGPLWDKPTHFEQRDGNF